MSRYYLPKALEESVLRANLYVYTLEIYDELNSLYSINKIVHDQVDEKYGRPRGVIKAKYIVGNIYVDCTEGMTAGIAQ